MTTLTIMRALPREVRDAADTHERRPTPSPRLCEPQRHTACRALLLGRRGAAMQVDPTVYHMMNEDPGDVTYSSVGGLNEQIRELREVGRAPPPDPRQGSPA
eukprot:311677-Prymnesium_polylepis.1